MSSASNSDIDALLSKMKSAAAPLRTILRDLHEKYLALRDGKVADYIPELAKADPGLFGICVVTRDGQTFTVGDCQQQFTIQSISKPFVFGLALEMHGREAVLAKVGVEPTGEAFNAIVLDELSNRPFNPMVNWEPSPRRIWLKARIFPNASPGCSPCSAGIVAARCSSITRSSCRNDRPVTAIARLPI